MKFKIIFLALIWIIFAFTIISADVPKMINYQGKLANQQGALITDTLSIQFTIYDDSTGGATLWTETQPTVVVQNGVFSVLLGSMSPIPDSVFDGDVRYLGVIIGDESEMTPRKAIVSVGYAYKSEYADTAKYAKVAVSDGDWGVNGDNIYRLVGKVGIGTETPLAHLHIQPGGEANAEVRIVGGIPDNYAWSLLAERTPNILHIVPNTTGGILYLGENSGKIGIGTGNPQGKLDIYGSLAVAGNEGIAGQVLTSQGSGTNPVWSDVIPNGSVSQAKLKTATGEVSVFQSGGSFAISLETLPGGTYGFYPQLKVTGTQNPRGWASIAFSSDGGQILSNSIYTTLIRIGAVSQNGTATTYAQQRYVTSSGKDHWIFFLIDEGTKQVLAGYQAPDHPCYGSSGNENDIPHPFGSYDPKKHEIILVDNEILSQLKSKVTSKRSLLTVINEDYEIDFDSEPVYQPREIIEIDEYGDKKGDILKVIKTPEWAKILIGKDEIYLKRRLVETLPSYISFKKLKSKSNTIAGHTILSQSAGIESDTH